MAHIKWDECGLEDISQKRMRKEALTSCVNGNVFLVLFFFQTIDRIFTDKCECFTKFKEIVINEVDTALVHYCLFFI